MPKRMPTDSGIPFAWANALGGSWISSPCFDPQGEAHAQQLIDRPMHVPKA